MKFYVLVLFLALLSSRASAAESVNEPDIISYVDSLKTEQAAFLEKLVNINSGTENVEGVTQVGNLMKEKLDALGFETTWHDLPAGMGHAGSLVAVHEGKKSAKRILLIGHLDTVFSKTSGFQKFASLDGQGKAKGPGVIDDKGGIVAMIYALAALEHSGALQDMNIVAVLVGDEEMAARPTEVSRKVLRDEAEKSDVALGFEYALASNQLVTDRRGLSEWFLTSTGLASHSATIFQPKTGFGAIYEAARVLDAIRSEFSKENGLTINPGLMLGGTGPKEDIANSSGTVSGRKTIVAESTLVHGDLRFTNDAQQQAADSRIKEIASKSLPQTHSDFVLKPIMPVMEDRDSNRKMLAQFSQISLGLNGPALEAAPSALRGGADISYISKLVSSSIDGLGPWGEGAHTENETIDMSSLPIVTKRVAIYMARLNR